MTQKNNFKTVQDKNFAVDILQDITVINFTEQEQAKLKQILIQETGNSNLFSYINMIYRIIGANFKKPGKFLIIPFINEKNKPHLNIQKMI
jgi:hypothetical protein